MLEVVSTLTFWTSAQILLVCALTTSACMWRFKFQSQRIIISEFLHLFGSEAEGILKIYLCQSIHCDCFSSQSKMDKGRASTGGGIFGQV